MNKGKTKKTQKKEASKLGMDLSASDFASAVLSNTSDGVSAINLKGEIMFWNEGAEKLSGYSKEEVLGKNISLLYRKQDIPDLVERIKKAMQGEFFTNKELIMVDKDQKEHTVLLTLNGLKDKAGNITHLIGVTKDITELSKSKVELLKVKEKAVQIEQDLISQLETTLNNISDGFVSLDTEWCYTYVNNKAAELLGRPSKDLIGKHIWTEFPEGVGLPFYHAYNKAADTQETIYFEEYYEPFDKWFENRIYPSKEGLVIYFTDITENRKAEIALKESEQRFGQAFDNSPIPISILNLRTGKRLAVNKAFLNTFGYTEDDLLNEDSIHKVNIAVDQKEFKTGVQTILKEGILFEFPFSMYTKDRKIRHVLINATKAYANNDDVYITSYLDITERKAAESALIKEKENAELSESYLDNIINNIGDPVFVKDDQSRLVLVNDAFCKLWDLSREKILGKTLAEDVPDEEMEAFLKIDRQVLETGIENIIEETLTVRGESTKTIYTRKSRYIDNKGKKHLIGVIRDITDRKKAEEVRLETLSRLDLAVNTAKLGVWSRDVETDELFWNDRLFEIYGISPDEFESNMDSYFDRLHPDDRDYINEVLGLLYEGEPLHDVKFRIIRPDNEIRYIDSSAAPLVVNGRIEKYIGINRDITNQKKSEEALRTSEEKFRNLSESAQVAIAILGDYTGKEFLYVNTYWENLTGYTKEEAKDLDIMDIVAPDHREVAQERAKKRLAGEEVPMKYELKLIAKNGDIKWVNFTAALTKFGDKDAILTTALDITDKKLVQDNLAETLSRLNLAVNTAKLGVWSLDVETDEVHFNDEMFDIFGFDPEKFDGSLESVLERVHDDDIEQANEKLKEVYKGKSVYDLVFRVIRPDKGTRFIDWSASPVMVNGRAEKIIGIVKDTTSEREKNLLIQSNELRYRTLFESARDAIFIVDGAKVVDVNQAMVKMFGYKDTSEVIGKMIWDFAPKKQHDGRSSEEYVSSVLASLETDQSRMIAFTHKRKDNSFFETEVSMNKFILDGQIFLLGVVRDVTERKKSEDAIKTSEEKFRNLSESAQVAIAILGDASGQEILYVNSFWEKLMGYSKEEAKNLEILDVVAPEHRELVEERARKRLAGEEVPSKYELKLMTKSGELKWVNFTATVTKFGESNAILTTALDITERKIAEEKIKDSEATISTILNSLPASVCVIDDIGKIHQVNDSWKEFGELNGMSKDTDYNDYNYFDVCKDDTENEDAKAILNGLLGLFDGKTEDFEHEYPCHTPDRQQWFSMRANIMKSRKKQIVISHIDITSRKLIEERLEQANLDLVNAVNSLNELKQQIEAENIYLKEELKLDGSFNEIVGSSKPVRRMLKQVQQVAKTDTTVLVLGETGTGKELIARAIHNASDRKDKPLVKVNCSALPSELIESEFFGHEAGAFTSAVARKIGRFELANGGTIFLDEIGDLPLGLQTRLLRVLQESEFERVGGEQTIKVDVRVITATNRNLEEEVLNGNFRQDLYYRLNVFPIKCPPLRERIDDVPILVNHFVNKYNQKLNKNITKVNQKVIDRLMNYKWPGNVRELEHVIERAVILNEGGQLRLGAWFMDRDLNAVGSDELTTLENVERDHINKVLERVNWKIRGKYGAAEILGLKPTTLESRMKKWKINRKK